MIIPETPMAHHTIRPAYSQLIDRLNRFPQGAPPAEALYRILALLVTEREAELVSTLPIRPFTAMQAAERWKMEEAAARVILDELAGRAILLDLEKNAEKTYLLPPPMAGFFEFSRMRLGGNPDQKALAELYYQYLNVEEDFVRDLFANGETRMGRAFVQERALTEENALHVLDYERASGVIRDSWAMSVGTCYCRHKMLHVGRACAAPLDICMTFNTAADSLARYGYARKVEKEEGLDLLHKAWDLNLVQFGENVREGVSFICNCCGCCCEAMIAARRFGFMHPVHPSNFLPVVDTSACTGCGKCVEICPVEAMTLVSANDPHNPRRRHARPDGDACLGCGVCTRVCPGGFIRLESRPRRTITPL
ncbi:MAG TPA: 4Fe-4S binding protein, partial [Armatimonadota bacterium]|nr:4Fe-4S binding protein [Armatimonadota bacterium]